MKVYKLYPAASDVRSVASSMSVLGDTIQLTPLSAANTSQMTLLATDADSVMSPSRDDVSSSDGFVNVTTFGDMRRMVLCLAEHVVHGEFMFYLCEHFVAQNSRSFNST